MKIERTYLLTVALVIPLLLLVMGCDASGGIVDVQDSPELRLDCFVPDGATHMVFEASGAVQDEGTITGEPLSLEEESFTRVVYRQFEGQKGHMVMRVEVGQGYGSHLAEGSFTVLGGNGSYARLQKEGDFYAALDERGEMVEVFEGRLSADQ